MSSLISHSTKSILTFLLIFNLSFSAIPKVSTGRLCLLIMTIIYGQEALRLAVNYTRQFKVPVVIFLSLLPFTLIWVVFHGSEDSIAASRALFFLLFSIYSSFLFVRMCRFSLGYGMIYFLAAILMQSFFVYASVFYSEFRYWTGQVLVGSGNIDFSEGVRFSGLSNGGGADLSLTLSLGVISAVILFSQTQNSFKRVILFFLALFITTATIFTGRTGFYISIFSMLGFIAFSRRTFFIPFLLIVFTLFIYLFISSANTNEIEFENNDIKLNRTINWAFDLFLAGESSSANALVAELSKTRELDLKTILMGSGRVQEFDGSNYSGHDSGYLHSLYSLGLPISILFYSALWWVLWRKLVSVQGPLKIIGLMLIALVFVVEIKEPFIFKYTLPFFVLVYVHLASLKVKKLG